MSVSLKNVNLFGNFPYLLKFSYQIWTWHTTLTWQNLKYLIVFQSFVEANMNVQYVWDMGTILLQNVHVKFENLLIFSLQLMVDALQSMCHVHISFYSRTYCIKVCCSELDSSSQKCMITTISWLGIKCCTMLRSMQDWNTSILWNRVFERRKELQ